MQTHGGGIIFENVSIVYEGAPTPYWITTTTGMNLTGVKVDTTGNVYLSALGFRTAKLDSQGGVIWTKGISPVGTSRLNDIAISSSGNIHVVGDVAAVIGSNGEDMYMAKYDNSGNILWQNSIGPNGSFFNWNESINTVEVDSNGNVIVGGSAYRSVVSDPITQPAYIASFNSSGTQLWQAQLGNTSLNAVQGMFVDSQNNILIVARDGGNPRPVLLAKINPAGTTLTSCAIGATNATGTDIVADSTGNIYVSCTYGTGGNLVKLNSNMTSILWERYIAGIGFYSLAIDANDDIYTMGGDTAQTYFHISKINTAGTFQWQRTFTDTNGENPYYGAICVDNNGSLYVANGATLLKVPNDGSLTGTYGTYTYQSASNTVTSGSFFTLGSLPRGIGGSDFVVTNRNLSTTPNTATFTKISIN